MEAVEAALALLLSSLGLRRLPLSVISGNKAMGLRCGEEREVALDEALDALETIEGE